MTIMRRLTIVTAFLLFGTIFLAGAAAAQGKGAGPGAAAVVEMYKVKCATCHMMDGNSAIEMMNFADGKWKHGTTQKQLAGVIREGIPGTAMLSFKGQLSEAEIQALARYVRAFDKKLKGKK
jgi:mono/diheme cytochrome c family protein